MDKKYFAFIDGEQRGPYDLKQLTSAGVRPSTYVWCKDMDDWHRADEVPEICDLFRQHLSDLKESKVINQPLDAQTVAEPLQQPQPQRQQEQQQDRPRASRRFYFPEQEPQIDLSNPPQVSMALALLSMLLCFLPTGIAAVYFAYKARKTWEDAISIQNYEASEEKRKAAHEYGRLAKMWLGLTVAFGLIFWTFLISFK